MRATTTTIAGKKKLNCREQHTKNTKRHKTARN